MTKSSIKVKFISTLHPNYRDGLLKANIEELHKDEPIFYKSLHQYYECRHLQCIDGVSYKEDEKKMVTGNEYHLLSFGVSMILYILL